MLLKLIYLYEQKCLNKLIGVFLLLLFVVVDPIVVVVAILLHLIGSSFKKEFYKQNEITNSSAMIYIEYRIIYYKLGRSIN